MNSLRRLPLVFLPLLLAAGCSPGLLAELDRVQRDPTLSAPRVSSLDRECRIEVSWDTDAGAEEYVLERAQDAVLGDFRVVYRGQGTSYSDTDCQDQGRYLYRLSKVRGNRLFGPSGAVLGVASATCRDELEPNDSEQQATELNYTRRANLFYYRATPSLPPVEVLQDDDWYAFAVPPQYTANLLITQAGLAQGSQYTFLYFSEKGTRPVHVVNNQLIAISNPSPDTRRVLFKLCLNPTDFMVDPTLGGGILVDYQVSLYSTVSR
jgi:hypothetical protein